MKDILTSELLLDITYSVVIQWSAVIAGDHAVDGRTHDFIGW